MARLVNSPNIVIPDDLGQSETSLAEDIYEELLRLREDLVNTKLEDLSDIALAAKGDLISASAAATPSILTVGANGTVLLAASGETTGQKWYAGGADAEAFTRANLAAATGAVDFNSQNLTGIGTISTAFDSGASLIGDAAYSGFYMEPSDTNDDFIGIATGAPGASAGTTQAGILFQGSSLYGTKIHLQTTNSYAAGMKSRVIIDHYGRVTIDGDDAPGDANGQDILTLEATHSVVGSGAQIRFQDSSIAAFIRSYTNAGSDVSLVFGTGWGAPAVRMTIDNSGNVTLADGSSFNLQEDITFTGATTENLIKFPDNLAVALQFAEAANPYLTFITTDGAEEIRSAKTMAAADFAKTGWPLTPGVTLGFDDANLRLTVTDGGSAYYYIGGVRYTLGGNKTVDITDTEGLWYLYFDGATLTASQTIWSFSAEDKALVAIVYWDAANNKQTILGYELHSFAMDGANHARLHYGGGAAWESGLLVSDAGSEVVDVSAGDIWDEDLNIPISDGAGAALFEQVLSPAEMPVYYRSGASDWRIYETADKGNATDAGYVDGSNNLHYNKLNGTWASTIAGGAKHVAYWVVATNDQTEPVALIMGQREDTTLAQAKSNNVFSGLSLAGLPFEEMVVLARVILKETGSGVYYTLEDIVDLRATNISGSVTSPLITDHGGLGGLGDDDHAHYFLADGSRTLDALEFTDGGSTVDIIRDEDDMATDDASALATQQSIKAYVDAQAGGMTEAFFFAFRTDSFDMANKNTWYDYPWNVAAPVKKNITHDHSSSGEQITIDGGGTYQITWSASFRKAASMSGVTRILDDGTEIAGTFRQTVNDGAGGADLVSPVNGSIIAFIAASSVIELQVGALDDGADVAYYDDANSPDPSTFVAATITITKISDDTS